MIKRGCFHCGRAVADGAELCHSCTGKLVRELREVPGLVDELLTTYSRQDRIGSGGGSEQPVSWKEQAPDAVWVLGNVLVAWARELAELHEITFGIGFWDYGSWTENITVLAPPVAALHSLRFAARWLDRHSGSLRTLPDAGQAHDEITDAIANARHAIDRLPALAYRGPCSVCDASLYAVPHAQVVRCRDCGTEHDGPLRRAWLLEQARGHNRRAAEISRDLPGLLGRDLSVHTLRHWVRHGQLLARGYDRQGHQLFNIGEVIDLALRTPTRRRPPKGA